MLLSRSVALSALLAGFVGFALPGGSALAQAPACTNTASFDAWLEGFKRDAVSQGISPRAVAAALDGVTVDQSVIQRDRRQGVFKQSFEQFSGRMVNASRLRGGAARLKTHAATLARIERDLGVPPPVVVAIWGLETDYGAVRGNFSTIRSLASLAYDCRRSAFFRGHLLDALRIVDRGDMTPAQMRGGWAGEIGQTQFMPTSYVKFALDYDGDRRRDLVGSPADVMASTANYLKGYGWQRGQPWGEGTANYAVIQQWNKSSVYAKTIAYFATRLAEGS